MQLDVRDIARLLKVNEKTIYRWLKDNSLPAYRVNNQYRFNRAEILEWATSRRIGVSAELFEEPESSGLPTYGIAEALTAGGINYRVEGSDKRAALKSVLDLMRMPDEVDREYLLQVLLAREAMASTGIGDGIAIPHVRNPIVLHISRPMISLGFMEHPIDFGALDHQPVYCLFTMVSPTVRAHLSLLSRLAFALRDPGFKRIIQTQGSREQILQEARRVDAALAAVKEDNGGDRE